MSFYYFCDMSFYYFCDMSFYYFCDMSFYCLSLLDSKKNLDQLTTLLSELSHEAVARC
jgi:hypothetical protein